MGLILINQKTFMFTVQITRGSGCLLRKNIKDYISPEDVSKKWEQVTDLSNAEIALSIQV